MTMRPALEQFLNQERTLLVFTTQGHVYVGTLTDVADDTIELTGSDNVTTTLLNLNDVSTVRPTSEEVERPL